MFIFFVVTASDTAAIYPAGETLLPLLVIIIDSNVLFCFYCSVATTIYAIPPNGSHPSYLREGLFSFFITASSVIYAIQPPGGGKFPSPLMSTDD